MDRRPVRCCGLDRSIIFPVLIGYHDGPVRSQSFSSLETGPSNTTVSCLTGSLCRTLRRVKVPVMEMVVVVVLEIIEVIVEVK
jgi:hypothetical protein